MRGGGRLSFVAMCVTLPAGNPLPPEVHAKADVRGRVIIVGDVHGCLQELQVRRPSSRAWLSELPTAARCHLLVGAPSSCFPRTSLKR